MTRRALCIGINDYPGTGSDLRGCVNDAEDWGAELTRRGYDVTTLLDAKATLAAMTDGVRELVEAAQPDDVVVITYSGHGTWLPDRTGDEADFRDEALCPHDIATAGPLLDDTLFEIFTSRRRGAQVVMISDSCHSGTLARVAPPLGDRGAQIKFLNPQVFLGDEARSAAARVEKEPVRGRSRSSALVLAGCRDTEYSYDTSFGGRPNGAFTRVALDDLAELGPQATYREWLTRIRKRLPSSDYPQTPQLDATSSQRAWRVLP